MKKFNLVKKGYDPEEVNKFIDQIIGRVEVMVDDIKEKDAIIAKMESVPQDYFVMKEKLEKYDKMEATINRAILVAEETSDQIKTLAHQEREMITNDAKKNASRIINEALLKAEKIDREAEMLKRNVAIFKRRLRDIIESQLEIIDEIDKTEL